MQPGVSKTQPLATFSHRSAVMALQGDGMRFEKFEALGNDFIIIRESAISASPCSLSDLALRVCDRHFGIGADGVEVVLESSSSASADFAVRLFNADGGETPISGNGTRCVAAWIFANSLWSRPEVTISTGAGTKKAILKDRSGNTFRFEMDMGRPRLKPSEIPVVVEGPLDQVVGETLQLSDCSIIFSASSMGNPHCSVFVDGFESLDWRQVGAEIETHPCFPERTNVEFIRVLDRNTIEVRFWERGVGATLASGTGACGAAVASILNDLTDRTVRIKTEAGELKVEWREDGLVYQTGEARRVFSGEWHD